MNEAELERLLDSLGPAFRAGSYEQAVLKISRDTLATLHALGFVGQHTFEARTFAGEGAVGRLISGAQPPPRYTKQDMNENARRVWDFFTRRLGFTPEGTAGIVGNLMQESRCDPTATQHPRGPGRGLAQWTLNQRWAALVDWARKGNRNEWDLYTQLEWLVMEMRQRKHNGMSVYDYIRRSTDVDDATTVFEARIEQAGIKHMDRRKAFAWSAISEFGRR